jgi:hypothetical protein
MNEALLDTGKPKFCKISIGGGRSVPHLHHCVRVGASQQAFARACRAGCPDHVVHLQAVTFVYHNGAVGFGVSIGRAFLRCR